MKKHYEKRRPTGQKGVREERAGFLFFSSFISISENPGF